MRASMPSSVQLGGFGPNFRPKMPHIIWPQNKNFQKRKKHTQAFTQAITKHKKGRNQAIHAFCGATKGFGPNFSPKMPQIWPKKNSKKERNTPRNLVC